MTYKVEGKVETMEGYWNKGKLHGFAKAKYAHGDTYTGFFRGRCVLLLWCVVYSSDTLPPVPQDHMFVKYIETCHIQENG